MSLVKKHDPGSFLSGIRIEVMRKKHLDQVLEIENRAYPNPWSKAVFLGELAQGITRSYVVALSNKRIVGYCGVLYVVDEAHITNIAVDPDLHRSGVGTKLLAHIVRLAWERNVKGITLEVRVSNYPAQRLYQKFGFQPAGVRKGYYPESGEDAMIMWAYDIDSSEYHERIRAIEVAAGIEPTLLRTRKLFRR